MATACYDRSVPNHELPGGIEQVPITLTDVSTKNVVLTQLHVCNASTKPISFTVLEASTGFPIVFKKQIKEDFTWAWDHGLKMSGVSWVASDNGLYGEIFGYSEG